MTDEEKMEVYEEGYKDALAQLYTSIVRGDFKSFKSLKEHLTLALESEDYVNKFRKVG